MGKKKAPQYEGRLQGEESVSSQSGDSDMYKDMDDFNSEQSWSALDNLEQQLFNGSHELSSPQDLPKKPRKRDRRKQRQEEIIEYQQALKIAEQQNKQFINPFQSYKLNVNQDQYQKLMISVIEGTTPPQGAARMLGLKSLRILHEQKLFDQFQMIKNFVGSNKIPEWIIEAHKFLLTTSGDTICRPVPEEKQNMEEFN